MPSGSNLYVVVASALNVRDQPSTQGNVIAVLNKGEKVERQTSSADFYWYRVRTARGAVGWCSLKYLRAVAESEPAGPPWLAIARAEIGTKELPGPADNPRIVQYLSSTTLEAPARLNDETPWCSAFVNWCLETAGYEGTDSARAKSWLQWGRSIATPSEGCIVVLTRQDGGHVGFYVGETEHEYRLLGGNQRDQVCEMGYSRSRLLGFRLPGLPNP